MSFPPRSSHPQHNSNPDTDDPFGPLLLKTWHMLHQQSPPPSLREILGAYNQKGNGDRELLLAMLSAKSSEDQRLASLVQLHQTLLQSTQPPSAQPPDLPHLPSLRHPPPPPPRPGMPPHLLLSPPPHLSASAADFNGTNSSTAAHSAGRTAPPSPSSLSQSSASGSRSSSSLSPRTRNDHGSLTLPPIHTHLAQAQKRRRMEGGGSTSSTHHNSNSYHFRQPSLVTRSTPSPVEEDSPSSSGHVASGAMIPRTGQQYGNQGSSSAGT